MNTPALALRVIDHIPAMVAYWDAEERCRFSNAAYRVWFGRGPEEMAGITLADLLGPIYEKNVPHIRAALRGERQVFERSIPVPGGEVRESIATYTPDVVDGVVRGFSVHVADVTQLRQREMKLEETLSSAIAVLEKTKRSFRSKELGLLRQQLVALAEHRAQATARIGRREAQA